MVSFTDTNEKEGTDMSSGIYTRSKARVPRAPLRASSGTERSTSSNIERPRRSQACCTGSKINIYVGIVGNVITNQYPSGSTEMEPGAQPEESLSENFSEIWKYCRRLIIVFGSVLFLVTILFAVLLGMSSAYLFKLMGQ